MSRYDEVKMELVANPKVWLLTGVAGFIGSNLLEALLSLNQKVVGLDSLVTGHMKNMDEVRTSVSPEQWSKFTFINGDINDYATCKAVVEGVDYVLHQAALGSVPRSVSEPIISNSANVTGFLNVLHAAKEENVRSFTYAASSSTYGDHPALPKVEENIGNPLSPYAVTKYVNELYAGVYARTYEFKTIGLRYFNVFGKRQDPNGAYAAVVPKWVSQMINGEEVFINGDGETSRDFCFIENVIQMNLLSATASEQSKDEVYNVAVGGRTSLNELYQALKGALTENSFTISLDPTYRDFRAGDVRHSQADISKARLKLGYAPTHDINAGIKKAIPWYISSLKK